MTTTWRLIIAVTPIRKITIFIVEITVLAIIIVAIIESFQILAIFWWRLIWTSTKPLVLTLRGFFLWEIIVVAIKMSFFFLELRLRFS